MLPKLVGRGRVEGEGEETMGYGWMFIGTNALWGYCALFVGHFSRVFVTLYNPPPSMKKIESVCKKVPSEKT